MKADDAHALRGKGQHEQTRYEREYVARVGAQLAHPSVRVVEVKVEPEARVDLAKVANREREQKARVADGQPYQVVAGALRVRDLGPPEDHDRERVAHNAEQDDEGAVPDC